MACRGHRQCTREGIGRGRLAVSRAQLPAEDTGYSMVIRTGDLHDETNCRDCSAQRWRRDMTALVKIHYDEFLQFDCFTEDANAQPRFDECAGDNEYFTALKITDVTLLGLDKFFFRPDLIFPTASDSPDDAAVGSPLSAQQKSASVLIQPSQGHTLQSAGFDSMLIIRRVLPGGPPPSTLTPLSYEYMGNSASFARIGSGPVRTEHLIDRFSLQ